MVADLMPLFPFFVYFVVWQEEFLVAEKNDSLINEFQLTQEQSDRINLINELQHVSTLQLQRVGELQRARLQGKLLSKLQEEELSDLRNTLDRMDLQQHNLINEFQFTEEQVDRINLINKLQITLEQFNEIEMIGREYSEQIDRFAQEMQQSEAELTDLIFSPASSEQVRRKEREAEALKIQAMQVYFEKFLALREMFTLSQRQRIQNMYLLPQMDE